MPRSRRPNFTADQKLKILRLHLLEKKPISDLCDEFSFRPSQFHDWQKQFFENGAAAFSREAAGEAAELRKSLSTMEAKIAEKNEVIAELMVELVAAKKKAGVR